MTSFRFSNRSGFLFKTKWHNSGMFSLWWTSYSQILSRPSSGKFSSLLSSLTLQFSPFMTINALYTSSVVFCTHMCLIILFFSGFEKIYLVYTVDSCCCAVTKLCLIHWNPIDCIMPGSFVILSLRVCSNSCPLSQWCYLAISSHVIPFSFCLQSFPGSGSFPVSWLFAVGGQYFGTSVST